MYSCYYECESFESNLAILTSLSTSGARVSIIECHFEEGEKNRPVFDEVYSQAIPWDGAYDDASAWMNAVELLLKKSRDALRIATNRKVNLCVGHFS